MTTEEKLAYAIASLQAIRTICSCLTTEYEIARDAVVKLTEK